MTESDLHNPHAWPGSAGDGCPSLMDLAALLDGTLPAERVQAMQAHIDQCESCALAIAEVQQWQGESTDALPFVPQHVLDRAMALVAEPAVVRTHRIAATWLVYARRAAAVAASLGIGALGYEIGSNMSATQQASAASAQTESATQQQGDLFFGMFDSTSPDSITGSFFNSNSVATQSPEASS